MKNKPHTDYSTARSGIKPSSAGVLCALLTGGAAWGQSAVPAAEPPRSLSLDPGGMQHEVAVSGDILFGFGHATVPFNYAFAKDPVMSAAGVRPQVGSLSRESVYYGTTVSYAYRQTWHVDFSYAHGDSSRDVDVPMGPGLEVPADFDIEDDWLQLGLRYAIPGLSGPRWSTYVRAGVSYVTADLSTASTGVAAGLYRQNDDTEDIFGSLGIGAALNLINGQRAKLGLRLDAEGFYGSRSHDITEELPGSGQSYPSADIDTTLYGGFGCATVRFDYAFGRLGRLKAFVDGGVQLRYTEVDYDDEGTSDEVLWGPFVKVGFRYQF